jgi:hypothetical protein
MNLSDLKESDLVEIVRLYEQYVGDGRGYDDAMFQQKPEWVLDDLKTGRNDEYRIGSRWDYNSKLHFRTDFKGNLSVWFNPNFNPEDRETPECKEAEIAGEEFTKAAMAYLNK